MHRAKLTAFFLSTPTFNRTRNLLDKITIAREAEETPVIISAHPRPFEIRERSIRANFLSAVAFGAFSLPFSRRASSPLERRRKWERKTDREGRKSPTGLISRRMRISWQAEEAGIRGPVAVDIDRRSSYQVARGTVDGGSGVSSLRSGSCCRITHHQTVSQHYVARRSFPLPPLR